MGRIGRQRIKNKKRAYKSINGTYAKVFCHVELVETSRGSVENKPNGSFPRDSSATLGMTECVLCHVEQAKRRRNISRKRCLRSGTIK